MHVRHVLVDEQQAGDDLATATVTFEVGQRVVAPGRIIVGIGFLQQDGRSIMQADRVGIAGIVAGLDLGPGRDQVSFSGQLLALSRVGVALGRTLVVIEGHAGRDDVQHGAARMGDGRLE